MPAFYQIDEEIKTLSQKTGQTATPQRLADLRVAMYGGRGSRFDELVYLRNQNTDAESVNTHLSGAWIKFAGDQGVETNNRATQARRVFFRTKDLP